MYTKEDKYINHYVDDLETAEKVTKELNGVLYCKTLAAAAGPAPFNHAPIFRREYNTAYYIQLDTTWMVDMLLSEKPDFVKAALNGQR